jgi:hypothetical protein
VSDDEPYGGALGAFPYAIRSSDSWTFRAYAATAAVVAVLLVAVFVLSLVGVVASTANQTASVTLVRAFVLLVMLLVVVPSVAPVLLVARRHRLDQPVDSRYDGALAWTGFTYHAALYVGLVASVPPDLQTAPSGPLAPLVALLYGLPRLAGHVPPLVAALGIWGVHRWLGTEDDD